MIDSIGASMKLTTVESSKIMNILTNVREDVIKDTGEVRYKATTYNKKMNIYINGDSLTIKGSLSQYYKEDFSSMLWNEVPLAINKLEQELQVKLLKSSIFQIDLEGTFPVIYEPKTYYEYLGNSSYYNRFIEKNTLYYNSGNRKKKFYDKSKKVKRDLSIIGRIINHSMRFETSFRKQYLKRIEKEIGIKKLTFEHLLSPNIQQYLLNLWLNEYKMIEKHPKLNIDMSEINSWSDLKNKLLIDKVSDLGGIHELISTVKRSAKSNPKIDSKKIYKIKTGLNALSGKPLNTNSYSHLEEINQSIAITYLINYLSI